LFGWNRNLIYKILFLKLSSLPFFLCVVCFIFKIAMIMYIARGREFDRWCESSELWWRSFILFYL